MIQLSSRRPEVRVGMKSESVRVLLAVCALSLIVGCKEASSPTPLSTRLVPSPPAAAAASVQATRTAPPSPTAEPSWTAAASPTETSMVLPTTSVEQVVVRETTLSIPGYVYEPHLEQGLDEGRGVPYLWLDRDAYGQPSPEATVLRPFKAVVLENRYLRLTILPELGGRLYECIFRPTGQNIFYRNQVLKPTQWGPLSRERNWWLAAGGMEWAFPVHEHGYQWGVPWSYSIERSGAEAKVVLRDTGETRLRAWVEIGLTPESASFTVRPHVENPTGSAVSYQFWTNAMLTLGGTSLSSNTEFVYPTDEILIHSAGPDGGLPGEGEIVSWPSLAGRDLSRYGNWEDWLGFFAPRLKYDFVGAYNHQTGLGVVRAFSREEAPGVKLFAWGMNSPYALEYSDDGSQYFEIWGGPNLTFWSEDDIVLQPGQSTTWTEHWYPFQGIGGLDWANRHAAISLRYREGSLQLGLAASTDRQGTLALEMGSQETYRVELAVSPERPYSTAVPVPAGLPADALVSCRFLSPAGEVIAGYQASLKDLQD